MTKRKTPEPTKTQEGAQESETDQLEGALASSQEGGQASQDDGQGAKPEGDDTQAGTDEKPPETEPEKPTEGNEGEDEGEPVKEAEAPAKTSSLRQTLQDKDAARRKEIAQAEADLPIEGDITEEEAAEIERKEGLQAKLVETAQIIEKHENAIEKLKAKQRALMGELYPHTVKSDRHVDAVRGYLKSSQEERRTRGAHPARLKELLEKAGKAPIDAAFQRARSRGHSRPTRSPMNAGKAPAGDQAHKAKPGPQE